eukprot:UN33391
MFRILGYAFHNLCQYRCKEALEYLKKVPKNQQYTGWVLAVKGRCYFELHEYETAHHCFDNMRECAPERTKTLDVFSTCLWHLKEEVKVSVLGEEAMLLDKHCPETWIIIGNVFSLQKEHDNAIKFFRRAIQVDPTCAYAYTLSAHEYTANEDFDKAIMAYRHAIRLDSRHYNAWFGIGNIYHRQEQYTLAAEHFDKAISVNSQSAVIYCFLGITHQANGNNDVALKHLTKAVELTPSNPLARFHKGKVLRCLKRYQEAISE